MTLTHQRTAGVGLIAGMAFLLCSAAPASAHGFASDTGHATAQQHPPGVSSGSCLLTGMSYSVSTDLQKSSSRQFKDVTGTSVSFDQASQDCVEVSFSAEAATMPGEILVTQVVLDGATICLPGDNIFASDSPSSDLADRAMNYICPDVAAGNHAVKVQFKSRFGAKVALDYRTTIVRFAK